jgi:hypothetical protein
MHKNSLRVVTISKRLERGFISLSAILALTAIQRAWVHPSGGHTHRQADTIGMSIAFAEQVRERGIAAFDFLLYPRILQKGVFDGINVAEFPLLNVAGGPGFLFSSSPLAGVILTIILILSLNLWVAYRDLPTLLKSWGVRVSPSLGLALWLTSSTIGSQTSVIMPEGVALPLVVSGMARIITANQRAYQLALGILLCNLGIAVKPTAAIALGAIAFLPFVFKNLRPKAPEILACTVLSLVFPAWWYTLHAKDIVSFAQGPQIFALAAFHPFDKLGELGLRDFLFLLGRETCCGQYPFYFGWFFIGTALALKEWLLVLIYFLSLLAAIALDGGHIFAHAYYFIGSSIFAMILMARVLGALENRKRLKTITLILLTWGVLYTIRGNLWVWSVDSQYWQRNYWSMGTEARTMIDDRAHIITDDGQYPLKLLFIGRSGSHRHDGTYRACNEPQFLRRPLTFVSDTPPPVQPFCGTRRIERKQVKTGFAIWYVTLVQE